MEKDSLLILLNSSTATYNAGETVRGQLKLSLVSEKFVRGKQIIKIHHFALKIDQKSRLRFKMT